MKHIKGFNESFEGNSEKVIYDIENILLDLKDKGYKININSTKDIDDTDVIRLSISCKDFPIHNEIQSYDIIEYLETVNDYLSINYNYKFTLYANGEEYDESFFSSQNIVSPRYIIYYEFL